MRHAQDILFLVDDMAEKNKRELNNVLKLLEHPFAEKNTFILWRFTKAVLKATLDLEKMEKEKRLHADHIQEEAEHVVEVEGSGDVRIREPSIENIKLAHDEIYSVNKEGERDMSMKFSKDSLSGIFIPELPVPPRPRHYGTDERVLIIEEKKYALVFDRETNKGIVYVQVGPDLYSVTEPTLTSRDDALLKSIMKKYGRKMHELVEDKAKLSEIIEKFAKKENIPYSPLYFVTIKYYLMRDNLYAGKFEPFLHDKDISKVECAEVRKKVKVTYQGVNITSNVDIFTADEMNAVISRLAHNANVHLKKDEQFVFSYNGFRVEGVYGKEPKILFVRI